MKYKLLVSGFEDSIDFNEDEIAKVHVPLLTYLSSLFQKRKRRIVCLYAAPPGTGKSTRAALWEVLSRDNPDLQDVQALSIDGFHYTNDFLNTNYTTVEGEKVLLKTIKGAPETYNVDALCDKMKQIIQGEDVWWPYYDRNIHDPVPDKINITSPIIVIEGNWLLHKVGAWAGLKDFADFTVYHDAEEGILKSRLIERKIRGGVQRNEAEKHYRYSDQKNIIKVRENHLNSDAVISWNDKLGRWSLLVKQWKKGVR